MNLVGCRMITIEDVTEEIVEIIDEHDNEEMQDQK